jgi:hypothetical protein
MKVVIGAPVKDRAWVIPTWYRAIEEQEIDDVDVSVICIVSPSSDNTKELLEERGGIVLFHDTDLKPGRSRRDIDGHIWGDMETYAYMSDLRNSLTWAARGLEADYFLSLDSDIILPKNGLATLLDYAADHEGVVSPSVNMVARGTVWNQMSWVDNSRPSMAHRPIQEPMEGAADVVMACMLLDRSAMDVNWKAHRQGEDIGFCIDAAAKGVKLWWLPTVRCSHYMYQF